MTNQKVQTNAHVSSIHAACFAREIENAQRVDDLIKAAGKHAKFLIGKDIEHMRAVYIARRSTFESASKMAGFIDSTLVVAIGVLFVLTSVFSVGYAQGKKTGEREQAVLLATFEKHARESEAEQKRLGDMLSQQLSSAESKINKLQKEKANALFKTTSNTRCFSSNTVQLLNDGAPKPSDSMPATAGPPPARGGGSAAAKAGLTDTDVAVWIINAQEQYGICKARLNSLIAFERMR